MKNSVKKVAIVSAMMVLTAATSASAFAEALPANTHEIGVKGTAEATIITVDIPTEMSFAIDTNNESSPIIAPSANFTNKTNTSLDLHFLGAKASDSNQTKVVGEDYVEDWSQLGTQDTQTHIAFGIKSEDEVIYWSAAETAGTPQNSVGTYKLAPHGNAALSPTVKSGTAWQNKRTDLNYSMYFRIALSD